MKIKMYLQIAIVFGPEIDPDERTDGFYMKPRFSAKKKFISFDKEVVIQNTSVKNYHIWSSG